LNISFIPEVKIYTDLALDSYVEQFLLEDRINFKWLPEERLNKLKRYLEMFSEL